MTLDRRRFSASLAALGAFGAGAATHAIGQPTAPAAPTEGVNYVRLAQPLPVPVPGKIEVVEFFWYECPHCNAFEPALEAWAKRLPDDVLLQRVPVWFREEPFTAQQKLFYTIEALDLVATLHRRVFHAIHNERVRLRTPEDIAAFVLKQGVDPVKFMATYNSFAVQAKARQARQIAAAYKIDAVPAMGVQGRYYTTGSLANANGKSNSPAGSNDRMLGVVDALVAKVRKGA